MFEFCTDPTALPDWQWMACYLTTGKHMAFYNAFGTVLLLLAITAPAALALGLAGATAARGRLWPVRAIGRVYISIVRGVPDIAFFLFFVIALDQGFEWLRHQALCPDWDQPIRQGSDFLVCPEAKLPLTTAPEAVHQAYGFFLAVISYAIVFGAFTANVLYGAMNTVPRAQMETAEAYGMTPRQAFWRVMFPQMWVYALPGLSNVWMILIKATPLLFLLGVSDIVYWARELGGAKVAQFSDYPHPDWRAWYFLFLLVFYLAFTAVSERIFARLTRRLSRGQATVAGEALRKGARVWRLHCAQVGPGAGQLGNDDRVLRIGLALAAPDALARAVHREPRRVDQRQPGLGEHRTEEARRAAQHIDGGPRVLSLQRLDLTDQRHDGGWIIAHRLAEQHPRVAVHGAGPVDFLGHVDPDKDIHFSLHSCCSSRHPVHAVVALQSDGSRSLISGRDGLRKRGEMRIISQA
jgi:polar amino acid transport system permease protein